MLSEGATVKTRSGRVLLTVSALAVLVVAAPIALSVDNREGTVASTFPETSVDSTLGGPVGTLYGAAKPSPPSQASDLFTLDPLTGMATLVGPIGFDSVGGIDFHSVTNELYGIGRRPATVIWVLIVIDPITGGGVEVGPLVTPTIDGGHFDLSFHSDGTLFMTARSSVNPGVSLHTINLASGTATEIGDTTTFSPGNAIGFDVADNLLHANNLDDGTLYLVDQVTGVSGPLLPLAYAGFPALTNARPNAMDFELSGPLAYVSVNDGNAAAGPNYLATLNTATGAVIHIGSTINGLDALAWQSGAIVTECGDGTITLPSETCEPPGGPPGCDCCLAHETPGCSSFLCTSVICDADPFCCNVEWDSICVDAALIEPVCIACCDAECRDNCTSCGDGIVQSDRLETCDPPGFPPTGGLSCTLIDFEGVGCNVEIGTIPGTPNVTFGPSWSGLIDSDAGPGCGGNIANEPSPDTVAAILFGPDPIDFDAGVQFVEVFYSANAFSVPFTLTGWDGPGGSGSVVDSIVGTTIGSTRHGAKCTGDPNGMFCLWDVLQLVSAVDNIRSITLTGVIANEIAFDNLTVCTGAPATPFCRSDCTYCGDGIVDPSETCEPPGAASCDCCVANGTPGCSNSNCQSEICSLDPFCCDTEWDQICASAANQNIVCKACCESICRDDCTYCGDRIVNDATEECEPPNVPLPPTCDCCGALPTPNCSDDACTADVCTIDPFCCNTQWDSICADEALQFDSCIVCCSPSCTNECTVCPDLDGDGRCTDRDPCPKSPTSSDGASVLGEQIMASSDKTTWFWMTLQDVMWVEGPLSGVSSYTVNSTSSEFNSNLLSLPAVPPSGSGFYIVARPECPGGSWTSGGSAECLYGCPSGGRDGNLP